MQRGGSSMMPSFRPSLASHESSAAWWMQRVLARRDIAGLGLVRRLEHPHLADAVVQRVVDEADRRRRVEIRRVILDQLQHVARAAAAALVHQRDRRRLPVKGVEQTLRRRHHHVVGRTRHVGELPRPGGVVPAIGVGGGPALLEDVGHARVGDRAAGKAARGRPELAIPVLERQPDLELHLGVAGARDGTFDAAKRRQRLVERGVCGGRRRGRRERARPDRLRPGDGRPVIDTRCEALARARRGRLRQRRR